MASTNDKPGEREQRQVEVHRDELVERLGRAIRADGTVEPLPGLYLHRISEATEPVHGSSFPSFCVIAQGSKEIYLGEDCFRYEPGQYLLATVELPILIQIGEASKERPYLSVRLNLDPALVGSVMVEAGLPAPRGSAGAKAIDVSPLDSGLLDATVRLVRLVESPTEARVLMPLVTREIVYRLLLGAQSNRLLHLAAFGGATNRIATALERIRNDFNKPLRIESLARDLGMSASGFHAQFKAVTAMSPLQFQKQMRLQEARRLMIAEDLDAVAAGRRVGYDDASYFNREYKSLFGEPPLRDIRRLQATAAISSDL
jgi:AraC-like DNA-binding protein